MKIKTHPPQRSKRRIFFFWQEEEKENIMKIKSPLLREVEKEYINFFYLKNKKISIKIKKTLKESEEEYFLFSLMVRKK